MTAAIEEDLLKTKSGKQRNKRDKSYSLQSRLHTSTRLRVPHGRPLARFPHLLHFPRPVPVVATESVALVIRKEVGDPVLTQIRRPVRVCLRTERGVGDDSPVRIEPSLQIAEHELAVGLVVAEVRQRLL